MARPNRLLASKAMQGLGQTLGAFFAPNQSDQYAAQGEIDAAHANSYDAAAQHSLASALKAESEAKNEAQKTRILGDRPGFIDQSIAASAGTDIPTLKSYRDYMTTGKKPMRSDFIGDPSVGESLGLGQTPTFTDEQASKLSTAIQQYLPYQTNVGDIKVDDAAQAADIYRKSDTSAQQLRDMQGGSLNPLDLARGIAAQKGELLNVQKEGLVGKVASGGDQSSTVRALLAAAGKGEFDNLGNAGVFSSIGGAQQLNAVGNTEAGKNKAQAASAYAAANQHNASAAKTKQETQQGGKGVLQQTDQGLFLVNPMTAQAIPVTGNDGTALGKVNKPTADYLKSTESYQNMDDALTNYKAKLSTFKGTDILSPSARADISSAYQNSLLQAKEIYKLGVLNGGDERILKGIINNPLDIKSLIIPKEALLKQATDLQGIITRNNKNLAAVNKQPEVPLPSARNPKPPIKTQAGATVSNWGTNAP
jgi:hypothetical protein